jgi:cellulose synthase/poly-beta-1,6-N-acetylglucosamine synthase-like glycosyltransferase
MDALAQAVILYYVLAMAGLCFYGLHRYWLVWHYIRGRGRRPTPPPASTFDELPAVTVQLPLFNEPLVAERIITAACRLRYPRDRLQVQVLDDSTDECAAVARRCCQRLAEDGHPVEYRHRTHREGYKAGALADGLAEARGEYVALFDADFVPPSDFLERSIHHFTDPGIGMVQARWSHLNRDDSLLTQIQAMSLDAHFVVEQAVRAATGSWFNSNGTAGIWRRRCIDEAGGWEHDTLTEDTDLSYRAQLAGWRFRYLTDLACPAELPPTVEALLSQQHRWNKGLIQTAIKLLPRILLSRAPLRAKLEAWFHLTSPLPYVFILLLTLLAIPATIWYLPLYDLRAALALVMGTACLGLGTMAAGAFFLASQWGQGISPARTLLRVPALMAVGIGLSLLNSRAVLEALVGRQSPFVRTPKFNGLPGDSLEPDPGTRTRRWRPAGAVEVGLGLVMATCAVLAFSRPFMLVGAPFLVLFSAGYLTVGLGRLRDRWRTRQPRELASPLAVGGV